MLKMESGDCCLSEQTLAHPPLSLLLTSTWLQNFHKKLPTGIRSSKGVPWINTTKELNMKIFRSVSRCNLLSFCGFVTSFSSLSVPINLCQGASCQDGSSCVSLNNTHFCLCSLGYYYKSSTCRKGEL